MSFVNTSTSRSPELPPALFQALRRIAVPPWKLTVLLLEEQ